ncbi:SH3 domain-binding protein 2-like [Mytilus galloprovincialis]|uniref:SH3 domain-binding protein 2-like n=1 Tax=Mytilus galloprovincialis TaxID=29158 RepID=UPI003F7C87E3
MNREYDQQSAYSRIRQPFKKIPCQQLITSNDTTSGWVRRKKNKKWNFIYMALHKGCVYYYEKDISRTEIEGVSLFGFKSVQVATECTDNKALWAFKLVHRHPSVFCSQYFSAASENDLKFWISVFKKELRNANGEEVPSEYQEQSDIVDQRISLPPPLPLRRNLPPPRLPAEDINSMCLCMCIAQHL